MSCASHWAFRWARKNQVEVARRKFNGEDPLDPSNYSASFNMKHVWRDLAGKEQHRWLPNWVTPQIGTLESGIPITVKDLSTKAPLEVRIYER